MHATTMSHFLSQFFFFPLVVLGFELTISTLAGQALCHLSHSSSPLPLFLIQFYFQK
jgi:hypothetical protein